MQTPGFARRKLLGLGAVALFSCLTISTWANPVIWGGSLSSSQSGVLDATAIPTSLSDPASPIVYSDINSDNYDIAVYTNRLNRSGFDPLAATEPSWWFEGGTRSNLNQSINYSSVEYRFYSIGSLTTFAPVTGVHFRFEDAESEERFRNLTYLDVNGNEVSIAYNSPLVTYSTGSGVYHASDNSFDSGVHSDSGTQSGKWIDVNLGAIPIMGFKFQTGRSLSSYGSVLMGKLGNLTPYVNILGATPTDVTGSYRGLAAVSPTGLGTLATLLDGDVTGTKSVSMQFNVADPVQFQVQDASGGVISSDVLTLKGNDTDKFVLQMTYDEASLMGFNEELLLLGWDNAGTFVNAVDGNHVNEVSLLAPILRAYDPTLDFYLGNYGVDTENNTVWAVIDHNSDFAVTPAPEPTSAALLLCGALPLLARRRRARA